MLDNDGAITVFERTSALNSNIEFKLLTNKITGYNSLIS
jgi:hypothetical protein